MQRRRSCQNSFSIHVYVVPTAVCTPVLYTLIFTVQLFFLSDRSEHRIHPGDTTHTHRVKCWARVPRLKKKQGRGVGGGGGQKRMMEIVATCVGNQLEFHLSCHCFKFIKCSTAKIWYLVISLFYTVSDHLVMKSLFICLIWTWSKRYLARAGGTPVGRCSLKSSRWEWRVVSFIAVVFCRLIRQGNAN